MIRPRWLAVRTCARTVGGATETASDGSHRRPRRRCRMTTGMARSASRTPMTPNMATPRTVPSPIAAKNPRIGPAQHTAQAAIPTPTTAEPLWPFMPRAEQGMHDWQGIVGRSDLKPDPAPVDGDGEREELAALLLRSHEEDHVVERRSRVELEADPTREGARSCTNRRSRCQSCMRSGMASLVNVQAIATAPSLAGLATSATAVVVSGFDVHPHSSSQAPSGRCRSRARAARCSSADSVTSSTVRVLASVTLAATSSRRRSWTGPHWPPSQAIERSLISSSVQPSCLARAMKARRARASSP